MGLVKLPAVSGFVLCCILLSASGLSAQVPGHTISDMVRDQNTTTGYTFCEVAVPNPGRQTETYYSDIFSVSKGNLRAASDAFVQFLAGKYSLHPQAQDSSTCQDLLSARQADAQSRLERTEGTNSSIFKVVKTGWVYSGTGPAGTPTSAQAQGAKANGGPAAPVSQLYGVCYVQAPSGWYFSAVLQDYGGDNPISQEFQNFLKAKYGVVDNDKCQILNSLADAQTYLQRAADSERSYRLNVVETGWTYSPAGSAAAAPSAPQSQGMSSGGSAAVATAPATSGAPPATPGLPQTTLNHSAASQSPSQAPANQAPQTPSARASTPSTPASRASELHERYMSDLARFDKDIIDLSQYPRSRTTKLPANVMEARSHLELVLGAYVVATRRGNYDQAEQDLQDAEATAPTIEKFLGK